MHFKIGGMNVKTLPAMTLVNDDVMTKMKEQGRMKPQCHLFYANRVVDIDDGLKKFDGEPEMAHTSGQEKD